MPQKKTHDEFINQIGIANPTITILGQYVNSKTKIRCQCNVCGYEWLGSPDHLLNGHGCRKCGDRASVEKRIWTEEKFLEKLSKVNQNVMIKSPYKGAKHFIECECKICGHTWTSKPAWLLSGHGGCRKCGYQKAVNTRAENENPLDEKRRLTQGEFESRLHSINPDVKILGAYHAQKKKIQTKCLVCGHIWFPQAGNLLGGYGCPNCNHGSTSYPEQYIYRVFVSVFGKDNVFSRDNNTIGKEIDIYIPSVRLGVEYGTWHWHKDRLNEDKEKISLCKKQGVRLITIIDNCPKDFIDDSFWCFYKKIERDDNTLHMLVIRLLSECGIDLKDGLLNYKDIDIVARRSSRKKTTEEFKSQLALVNTSINVLGEYTNSHGKMEVECTTCGHVWLASAGNLLRGMGCPECRKRKISQSKSKPVLCIETGLVYESITSASKAVHCNTTSISSCCQGKQEMAGGYHWKYFI